MTVIPHLNTALRRVPVWLVYLAGLIAPVIMFGLAATGNYGVEPIKALEHELGELSLQVMILGLAITPLRKLVGLNLMKFRRAIGVLTFYLVFSHFLVWLVLDVQILSQVWADILKRPYVTVGFGALLLMLPLVITSNNWSIRKLGPRWRKLHKLVYPAVVLGGVHYVMLTKTWQLEPMIYLVVILGLLATRLPKQLPMLARG